MLYIVPVNHLQYNQERKTKGNAATETFSFIRLRFQGQRYFYILIQPVQYSIFRSLASLVTAG